jgi:uncharacterized protein Veg
MKFIIFVLLIALLGISQAQTDDWSVVLSAEVNTSQQIQDFLTFGLKYVVNKAVKDLTVADTPYHVTQVGEVFRQIGDDEVKYKFTVDLDNYEGTKLFVNFIVQYQPSKERVRVQSFSYRYTITETACLNEDATKLEFEDEEETSEEEGLNEEEANNEEEFNLPGGWLKVDREELNTNQEIRDLLDYGAGRLIEEAVKDGKVPDNQFTVVYVYKVLAQLLSGNKYKFYVLLNDGQGTTVKAIFVVYYQSWTGRKDMTCYRYSALVNKSELENNEEEAIAHEEQPAVAVVEIEDEEEEEEEEAEVKVEAEVEVKVEVDVEEEEVKVEVETEVEVTVEEEEEEEEQEVVEEVVEEIEEEEVEEEETNEESTLVGGWSDVDLSEVENDEQIQSLMNYGAEYVAQKAIDDNEIPDTAYEVAEIYSVQRQVVNGLNYRFEVKLDNGEGTTVNATYVVWYQASSNTREVTSWQYHSSVKELDCQDLDPNDIDYSDTVDDLNEESNEDDTITDDYSVVDESEVMDNEEIQNLLDLGVEAVLEGGRDDGKIPDTAFEVTEVYRVWRRNVDGIKYKFHVKLDNGEGLTVNTIFVVQKQEWSGRTKVTCSKYVTHS